MRTRLLILFVLCFAIAACGGKKQEVKKVDSPGNLYVQGIAYMKKKDWDKAISSFAKVRENYPFDPIALVAQIKQADSSFAKKTYAAAAAVYEDFVNSYPEDENAAYALRRLAECYEKQSPSIERDQSNTFKAVERFTFLKNRYPGSPYAKDADVHLKQLTQKLAAREVFVGEFYYRWQRYNASIIRFQYFLGKYPDAKDTDKALYYLALDYHELQNDVKSQSYLDRLKKEYPKSPYGGSIKRERKTLQVAGVRPTEAAAAAKSATAQPASPIVVSSYEEKAPRRIDLKPVDTPKGGETQPAAAQGTADKAAKESAPSPAQAGESTGAKAGAAGTGQAALAAAGVAGTGEKEESKKTDDKKSSLGFFSEKKPVDVVADSMEGLEKGKIIVFKGNVVAKQVDLYLFSDMLTAYINEETNEIDRAKAEGNVKIVKLDRTATCKEALFYNDKGEIVLKGDVIVFSGNDKVSGDVVTYYINEDRVHVQGQKDKRAKALISPK
jgi:outer membrane protein assembly factor BamD